MGEAASGKEADEERQDGQPGASRDPHCPRRIVQEVPVATSGTDRSSASRRPSRLARIRASWTTAHRPGRIAALRADLLDVEPTCSRVRRQGDDVDVIDDRNLIAAKEPLAWRPLLPRPYASHVVPLLGAHENYIQRLIPRPGRRADLR